MGLLLKLLSKVTPRRLDPVATVRLQTRLAGIMAIKYPTRYSTDEDAFDEIPDTPAIPPRLPSHEQNPKAVPDSVMETRRDALAAVRRKVEESSGAGKMKGKVGIITGVGPISGIGVSETAYDDQPTQLTMPNRLPQLG